MFVPPDSRMSEDSHSWRQQTLFLHADSIAIIHSICRNGLLLVAAFGIPISAAVRLLLGARVVTSSLPVSALENWACHFRVFRSPFHSQLSSACACRPVSDPVVDRQRCFLVWSLPGHFDGPSLGAPVDFHAVRSRSLYFACSPCKGINIEL